MENVLKATSRKFIATIIFVVVFVVATSWGILQIYNQRELANPAEITEVHAAADHSKEFGEYLEDQKEYEAHFLTLASSIKEQESQRVTRGLALTFVIVMTLGTIIAVIAAQRLVKPVKEAYESQERFLQDAAHELRNPLAAMTAALQQNKTNTPLVRTFRRQTKRLIGINEDLLYLEKRNKQVPELLNLSELLQDVVEEIQPIAIKKKVVIDLSTDDHITKVMAVNDYVRLMKNLISNAVKYSHEKSVVTVKQRANKHGISIVVRDSGIGIPKRDLENIGQRFFRASNTGRVSGTGLGLAIVQKILNTYGGSWKLKSTVNKGTTVSVTIPS